VPVLAEILDALVDCFWIVWSLVKLEGAFCLLRATCQRDSIEMLLLLVCVE
jgi:hypothetical protein